MSGAAPHLLSDWLESYRAAVDGALQRWLPNESQCPPTLAAAMRHAVFPGGKRLRPVLALLACEACGGQPADALPAACAVELVHCYSLVHDDLPAMDDDDLRRGRPTCHKVYGEATAILTGDALLTLAFEILGSYSPTPDLGCASCRELARAAGAAGMVGGQVDDLAASRDDLRQNATLETVRGIHERKTGAILRASVRLGGLAASATPEHLAALDRYGRKIGLAFQIGDDLLDLYGDEAKTGKRLGKDHSQGKLTFPALWGEPQSRQLLDELCRDACTSLEGFGLRGEPLRRLARFIGERDR